MRMSSIKSAPPCQLRDSFLLMLIGSEHFASPHVLVSTIMSLFLYICRKYSNTPPTFVLDPSFFEFGFFYFSEKIRSFVPLCCKQDRPRSGAVLSGSSLFAEIVVQIFWGNILSFSLESMTMVLNTESQRKNFNSCNCKSL